MADKKPKREQITTPRLTFKFPRLNEPDTKFKAEGEYSVKGIRALDEVSVLIEKLKPMHAEAVKAGKKAWAELKPAVQKKNPFKIVPFYSDDLDDEGNETGNVVFNFKLPATGKDKKTGKTWKNKPALFDAKGQPMVKVPAIWGGTEGKVSFEVMPFFVAAVGAGISLRLKGVQIIKLVQGGQKDASGYGFGVEEDGYEYDESEASSKDETEEKDDLDGDESEGSGDDADTSGSDAGDEQDF